MEEPRQASSREEMRPPNWRPSAAHSGTSQGANCVSAGSPTISRTYVCPCGIWAGGLQQRSGVESSSTVSKRKPRKSCSHRSHDSSPLKKLVPVKCVCGINKKGSQQSSIEVWQWVMLHYFLSLIVLHMYIALFPHLRVLDPQEEKLYLPFSQYVISTQNNLMHTIGI